MKHLFMIQSQISKSPLKIVIFQVTIEDQLLAGLPREEGEGEVEKVVKRQVEFETGTFGPPTVSISCTRPGPKEPSQSGQDKDDGRQQHVQQVLHIPRP